MSKKNNESIRQILLIINRSDNQDVFCLLKTIFPIVLNYC